MCHNPRFAIPGEADVAWGFHKNPFDTGENSMNFFISDAMAQTAGGMGAGGMESLILPAGLIVILYFLMIRPQMKRQKEHKKLIEALAKGDEVQTGGGLMGKVVALGDNFAQVEIAKGVEVKIRRQSVEAVMPKGTLKEL
ncbi:MAG: preprotein translocase subunit YajC [Sedimenticola sp.]